MTVCEQCWMDAGHRAMNNPAKSRTEHYYDLLEERKENPCPQIGDSSSHEDEKCIYCGEVMAAKDDVVLECSNCHSLLICSEGINKVRITLKKDKEASNEKR